MVNPSKQRSLLVDQSGDGMIGDMQDLVADPAAATAAAAATTQATAPAGGTGATEGAYDTSGNRDLAITSINAAKTDIAAQKVELDKLITDVADIRTQLTACLAVVEAHGLMRDV